MLEGHMKAAGAVPAMAIVLALAMPTPVTAHCDALDGPVVADARTALERSDPVPVLRWVPPAAEPEVRGAFAQALAVRRLGREAQALADRYFFETVVRLHRGGEGEPYTGLKAAGSTVDPAVRAADEALQSEGLDGLRRLIVTQVEHGLALRLRRVLDARKRAGEGVDRGREYVAAYTEFVHYAERTHAAASESAGGDHVHETRAAHP
jgi:hypothetical protein